MTAARKLLGELGLKPVSCSRSTRIEAAVAGGLAVGGADLGPHDVKGQLRVDANIARSPWRLTSKKPIVIQTAY